jgi:hypothetical protein
LGEDFKGMAIWVDTGISGSTGVFFKHMLLLRECESYLLLLVWGFEPLTPFALAHL